MKKGIIFDLDGTLWDASEPIARAWTDAVRDLPDAARPFTGADVRGIMGMTVAQIAAAVFPRLDARRGLEVCGICIEAELKELRARGGRLFAGVEQMLDTLSARLPLYIVSNCEGGYIETFLAFHGLGRYFADFECEGGTGMGKADNISLLAARNGLESAVYVGDTAGDAAAAAAAGLPFIWASYGFGSLPDAGYRIDTPSALPALAERLLG